MTTTSQTDAIREAARLLLSAKYVMALTGAGISVESGIPPFRGPGGLWTKYGEPPMNGYEIFLRDPKKAWEERLSQRTNQRNLVCSEHCRSQSRPSCFCGARTDGHSAQYDHTERR